MISSFYGFHPLIRRWFCSRFEQPTEPQRRGWGPIARGQNTLIAAPTGSGKTLAAFLACIDRLLKTALQGPLPEEVKVVYVSPLRALSNDMHRNLETPLQEINALACDEHPDMTPLRAGLRTGDTSSSKRAALVRRPPHILVTTPESLYLMLTAPKARETLVNVETVIVDEIHALVRDKRGSHLALTLERLEAVASQPLQRIGLSATQKPIEHTAAFLTGTPASGECQRPESASGAPQSPDRSPEEDEQQHGSSTLNTQHSTPDSPCTIIDVGHQRKLDLAIETPESELGAVCSGEQWAEVHDTLVRLVESHHSTLIFVNTRRLAERLTHQLTDLLGEEAVSSHHGSLSASLRLKTEQRLKRGELKAVVATASLELGIDIGYIDLVVQIGSPRSIATFLQRIGRSGHALGLVPEGRLFALTRDELLESMALMRAVRAGRLDTVPIPEAPLDVLAQQIVAEVSAQPWSCDELYALFRRAYPYRNLKREDFDRVVEILSEGIARSSGRSRVYLHHDHVNRRLRARRGARIPATSNAGAIPEVFQFRVVAEPERTVVGSLDEDFAVESLAGDVFLLGNTSWRILNVRGGDVNVADAHGAPPTIPFWRGEAPGRTFELSEEVSRLREELEERLAWQSAAHQDGSTGDPAPGGFACVLSCAARWLAAESNCTEETARQAVEYVAAQKAAVGVVPTQRRVIFERFFDESGGMQLVVHAPFGGRINKAWGLAMRKRFCRSFDFELQATADDDGFILSLGPQHSFPIESLFGMLTTSNARALLEQAVLAVPMFELRWRWNATRSLLVLRNTAGKRVPPAIQRFRAQDLLTAVFPRLTGCQEEHTGDIPIPDHPLVQQTLWDCLTEAVDLAGLRDVLGRIERGAITLLARDTREPSPFSYELLNSNPYAFLDGGEIQERRARAVSTRRTLSIESVEDLGRLDPEAIEQVRQEAQPPLRNVEELHDRLLSRVILVVNEFPAELVAHNSEKGGTPETADERYSVAARETVEDWFAELAGEQRAGAVTLPDGRTAWVAAERWAMATAAFPDLRSEPVLETPSTVRQEWTTAEARMAMVRGLLEVCGPIRTDDVARRLCLTESQAHSVLEALEGEGLVLRGRFTPEAAEQQRNEWQGHSAFRAGAPATAHPPKSDEEARGLPFDGAPPPTGGKPAASATGAVPCEWCHRGLLARIHRLTLQGLRREIEPVGVEVYQRFLFAHHGIVEGHRRAGSNGVFEVVSLLQGLDVPAACWERDVLPLRVEQYEPRLLDELCLAGEVGWGRMNPAAHNPGRSRPMAALTRAAPVSLFLRQDAGWLLAEAADVDPNTLTSPARHVYEVLCQAGAMFAADLLAETRMLPGGLDDALGELVTRGVVTADGFGGLRRLIDRNGSQSSNQTGSRRRASWQRPEPASSRKRRLLRQRTNSSTVGRWSVWRGGANTLVADTAVDGASNGPIVGFPSAKARPSTKQKATKKAHPSAEQKTANEDTAEARVETVEQWAWQLLRRWGLVFRDLLNRESCAPPWYELRQVYRRLEARGEVRGGRFLTDVSGEQFGLGETVRRLRQLREDSPAEELVVVSAADPVNLTGIITDHSRVPGVATNRVAFLGGRPVAAWQAGEVVLLESLSPQQQAVVSRCLKQGTTTDDVNTQPSIGKRDQSQADRLQSSAETRKSTDENVVRRNRGGKSHSKQKRYPNDIPRPLF